MVQQQTTYEILMKLRDEASGNFDKAMKKMGYSAKETQGAVKGTSGSFTELGNVVKWFVGLAAVRQTLIFLGQTSKDAALAERSLNQLRLAYKNTGRTFNEIDLVSFAKEMQAVAAAEDDATIAAAAMLANMTDLNDKGIKEMIELGIGISKVMATI